MLKLLSRSIRNDSESLAADLTKLPSVSPCSQHKLLPPTPNNILFWPRVVLLVLCFIFWMKGLGNYDWAHQLAWMGTGGTRGVSPGPLRSWDASIVPAPHYSAEDRWWTHYWGQLQGDCTIIALYLYTKTSIIFWGARKTPAQYVS